MPIMHTPVIPDAAATAAVSTLSSDSSLLAAAALRRSRTDLTLQQQQQHAQGVDHSTSSHSAQSSAASTPTSLHAPYSNSPAGAANMTSSLPVVSAIGTAQAQRVVTMPRLSIVRRPTEIALLSVDSTQDSNTAGGASTSAAASTTDASTDTDTSIASGEVHTFDAPSVFSATPVGVSSAGLHSPLGVASQDLLTRERTLPRLPVVVDTIAAMPSQSSAALLPPGAAGHLRSICSLHHRLGQIALTDQLDRQWAHHHSLHYQMSLPLVTLQGYRLFATLPRWIKALLCPQRQPLQRVVTQG